MDPITMAAIATAGSAILGMYQGRQQQQAQTRARQDQARINMYAPLFGQEIRALGPESDHVSTGAIQGAMTGYQMANQYTMNDKLSKLYEAETAAKLAQSSAGAAPNTAATGSSTLTPIVNHYAPTMSQGAPDIARDPYAYGRLQPIYNPDTFFGGR
jgi:hypothetical protein